MSHVPMGHFSQSINEAGGVYDGTHNAHITRIPELRHEALFET